MTQAEMINAIAKDLDLSKTAVSNLLEAFGQRAIAELRVDERVFIPRVGTLSLARKAARMGRNPKTGEAIPIAEKNCIKISMSKGASEVLNPERAK